MILLAADFISIQTTSYCMFNCCSGLLRMVAEVLQYFAGALFDKMLIWPVLY